MALAINTNVAALKAQRQLTETTLALGITFERLSSGLRINSSADDPAGLAISTRMTSQIRGMNVAIRNTNDGISLAQVADGALEEIESSLITLNEHYIDASNASKQASDREAIQDQITALLAEIQRTSTSTEFNGFKLINGSYNANLFQIGAEAGNTLSLTIATASLGGLGISVDGTATGLNSIGENVLTTTSAVDIAGSNQVKIASALDSISDIRSNLGAIQNRFEAVIANLSHAVENTKAAQSRIMDADFAEETAKLTRNSILQQAGVAILAQANQQPAIVLSLIGS
ncbi:MAG: flagellin FliC [Magnetococcales bacterium]|nr:flagellin FliC [Magnetococcales bacterium]